MKMVNYDATLNLLATTTFEEIDHENYYSEMKIS